MYRIADEPAPGGLAHLAVNPLWPFIAAMFGGIWLSWSWFLLNSIAVGSPTQRREWLWIGAGLVVSALLLSGLLYLIDVGVIAERHVKYAFLLLVALKLGVTYVLYTLQSHTIELYEYYGGQLKSGIYVVVAAYFVTPAVMAAMPSYLRIWMS
jgi:hypothetical protein